MTVARATEGKAALATSADAPNPFSALPRQEFRALAERLNANAVFVGKLRDRLIDPRTMTPGFQRRVAEELRAPLDVVVAHFAASQSAPRQFFKAESKPSTGRQQTFEEAVEILASRALNNRAGCIWSFDAWTPLSPSDRRPERSMTDWSRRGATRSVPLALVLAAAAKRDMQVVLASCGRSGAEGRTGSL